MGMVWPENYVVAFVTRLREDDSEETAKYEQYFTIGNTWKEVNSVDTIQRKLLRSD